jgi:hypothetical protein
VWELRRAAEAWLTGLVHRRLARWPLDGEQCFGLLQDHRPEAVLAAFAHGVCQRAIGAEYVTAHLPGPRPGGSPAIDLEALLRRLHLPTVRRFYPELARRAEQNGGQHRLGFGNSCFERRSGACRAYGAVPDFRDRASVLRKNTWPREGLTR